MLFPWQPEEQIDQYVQACPSVSVHECGYLDCISLCVKAGGSGQTVSVMFETPDLSTIPIL